MELTVNLRSNIAVNILVLLVFCLDTSAKETVSVTGMVSADHPQAAAVGAAILEEGGDAVDAAVATALALGATHPFASGIGGGGFAIVRRASGETLSLDFREVAPAAAHKDMFVGTDGQVISDASTLGAKAVGVPGELAGLQALHRRFGQLPWSKVVAPAVKLARDGFVVTPLMHAKIKEQLPYLKETVLGPYLVNEKGEPMDAGTTMRLPPLASTLQRIADKGADDFYRGEIAADIIAALRANGGIMTLADLSGYQPKERPVLKSQISGYEVLSMGPPSSGGLVLLQVLKVLETAELKALGHNSPAYLHRLTEALKHAFADRAQSMGDPDFVPVPKDRFLGDEAIQRVRAQFDPAQTKASSAYGSATHNGTDGGTSHFSVLDGRGNAVALTTTINTGFGSRFVAGQTGIILNNEMDDFVAQPGVPNSFGLVGTTANAVAPGKRPLSSMSPTIVARDGRPILVLGASGGPFIITSTLQVLLNILVFDMAPLDAVKQPRIHHQWMPDQIFYEEGLAAKTLNALEKKGHATTKLKRFSAVQVIHYTDKGIQGAADPSKGGQAVKAKAKP